MKLEIARVRTVVPFFLMGIAASAQAPSPLPSPDGAAPSRQVAASYGKLPLSFEPNRGQTDARVQFVSRGAGYTIFLSPTSAVFALQRSATQSRPALPGRQPSMEESAVVRMDLLGANPGIAIEPQDKLPGVANYMIGSTSAKWPTNLPTYAKTRSRNVYPGIDLVYHGVQGQLEYDFVLAPRADPSRIRLKFRGATPVVDASGDLVLSLGARDGQNDIRFHKPVLYQQVQGVRQPVDGRFMIARNEVRFQVGSYDRGRELVIDPVLLYSSYLGGSSQQSAVYAMAIDAAGQMYVTGITNALDYPTTPGAIEPTCPAGNPSYGGHKCGPSSASSAFVAKIGADGQSLVYSTYLGGSGGGYGVGGSAVGAGGNGSDWGTGIAVDASDNAWVVGLTNSNNFPITADAYSLYCQPAAIYSGAYLISIKANSCGGPNASGYYYSGTYSLFLVKLNPTGTSMLYGTFLGGTNGEANAQLALDAAGNVYVAGSAYTNVPGTFAQTNYYNYPTTASAYQTQALTGGAYSAFVTEFDPTGKSLLYSTMFGSPYQHTVSNALAVAAGKVFIGGYTRDPHLPTTPGAVSSTCPGGPTAAGPNTVCVDGALNAFVAEFDPAKSGAASLVFSTYLNGSVSTQGTETSSVNAVAADAAGNVYAAGLDSYTVSEGFPKTPGVLQPACVVGGNSGECDTGFVTKLGPTGALVWSTFYGSPSTAGGNQTVSAIALDAKNNVYIAANATGLGDYPLNNGFQGYAGGAAYVTELSGDGKQVLFGSFFGGDQNIYPTGLALDAAGNIYLAGYGTGGLPLVSAYQSTTAGGFNEGFFAKVSAPKAVGAATFVNAATSQLGSVAAGSIVTAYGVDLATGVASGNPTSLTLAGTSVKIVDSAGVTTPAPLYFVGVSPSQVNLLIPSGVALGNATITITSGDGAISAGTVTVVAAAPGLFALNAAGLVAAYVITAVAGGGQTRGNDFQVVNGAVVPLPVNLGPPAQQVFLEIYGTGIAGRSSLANVSVSIKGLSLPVTYAGAQGEAGLDQVDVQIPASLAGSGDTTLSLIVDGKVSNTAHVTIQ
jgi:uncharacterized protein (TIGR03437 family)